MAKDFKEFFEERKRAATESNATIQRSKQLSTDDKRRMAIERMTSNLKRDAERTGKEVSHESAHREAVRIAENAFRKVDG